MASTASARRLRRQGTAAEMRLWRHLRNRRLGGLKFRRQHPLGRFVMDFVCLDHRLAVELDGGRHASANAADAARSAWLAAQGFRVLRFWNHDVLADTDAVLEAILRAAKPG